MTWLTIPLVILKVALGGISRTSQRHDGLKELLRLTLEKQVVSEALDRCDCTCIFCERRTDDRTGP